MKNQPNNTQRLQAFTLTEVLVSMALSSILVVFTYMFYQMLGSYFQQVSERNELYAERQSFRTIFSRDIDQSDSIKDIAGDLKMYTGGDSVTWSFGQAVVRSEKLMPKEFRLDGTMVETGFRTTNPAGLVTSIRVLWPSGAEDTLRLNFSKTYALNTLIN